MPVHRRTGKKYLESGNSVYICAMKMTHILSAGYYYSKLFGLE